MTDRGLTEMLTVFEAAYRVQFRPQEVVAWRLLLAPLSDEEGMRAASALCRKSVYIPKPADIFRLVEEDREAHRIPKVSMPALPYPAELAVENRRRVAAMAREIASAKGMS